MFGKKQPQTSVATSEKEPQKPVEVTRLGRHFFFGPYILFPVITTGVWLATLIGLLALWTKDGKIKYQPDDSTILFISDVGAQYQRFFEIMCCITSGMYILTLFAERWLRHVDRIPADVRVREKVFDWIAILCTCIGSAGLIVLAFYNDVDYPTVHWCGTAVFVVFVALSAIFQSAEIWSLHKDHPDRQHLLRNSVYKLFIVTLAVATAVAFGCVYGVHKRSGGCAGSVATSYCNRLLNVAAALEWTVAFIVVFYFFTLVLDLWPASKSSPRYLRRLAKWQERHENYASGGHDFTSRKAFTSNPGAWQQQNGRAVDVNAPLGTHNGFAQNDYTPRASTAGGSEAGLMRQV